MSPMASQISSLTIVYSTVYSGADQRKHQSFASLAFVGGIHRWPMNSPHKGPVTRKLFPFHDVIMGSLAVIILCFAGNFWVAEGNIQNNRWDCAKSCVLNLSLLTGYHWQKRLHHTSLFSTGHSSLPSVGIHIYPSPHTFMLVWRHICHSRGKHTPLLIWRTIQIRNRVMSSLRCEIRFSFTWYCKPHLYILHRYYDSVTLLKIQVSCLNLYSDIYPM